MLIPACIHMDIQMLNPAAHTCTYGHIQMLNPAAHTHSGHVQIPNPTCTHGHVQMLNPVANTRPDPIMEFKHQDHVHGPY